VIAASDLRSRPQAVRINGIELHYVECGTGPPLVLIHGGIGDYRSWGRQLEAFSRHFRVISYSRRHSYPNHNPPAGKDYSALTDGADLVDFIGALRLGRVHLVGASYGAYAALVVAIQQPARVRSLVLVEPPVHRWLLDSPEGQVLFRQLLATVLQPARSAFENGQVEHAVRLFADGIGGAGTFDTLPRATRLDNAGAIRAIVEAADPFPMLAREALHSINLPTLLIEGRHTTPVHSLVNDALARCLPGIRRVIIDRSAHSPARENAEDFNRAVIRFLTAI